MGKFSKALQKSSSTAGPKPASVNPVSSRGGPPQEDKKTQQAKQSPLLQPDGELSRERWDRRLQLSTAQNSLFFESFRRLRTAVFYPASGPRPKTLLVTSTMAHEGKGFICANLGVALSRGMEHHAMLVDCDLRHPTLAGLFGLSADTGLVDYLQDQNVDLSMVLRKTGQPKLSLLPSGLPPKNPSELLESAKMIGLINEMAERYADRIILFDSPPGIIASETATLAKHVDGVILVVRHGASKKEDVKSFVDTVGREKILGVVFNAYPENSVETFLEKKMGYGYGYYQ